ncbi:hypothetical protein F896_01179 [Acinetobacter genomosp. 15BJ]|uniref:SMODS and SLOG-associating 2TM effector domain-containing protein n=1 Tax=Acinetobacter genomosp. 15BJ TaxID=106651 RepID=R9B2J4_9GAMM|nr:hypothetical protein [Acinetobacter genomosp. 15BJ]EOR08653.1 hypothetical protein F896_01179 [Acinetobacter genomosp. 15BJ]
MTDNGVFEKEELKAETERYKVLFDFYKSEYDALRNEYYKVEDKAAKYLTSLSVLSGILLVLFKEVINNFQLNVLSSIQVSILCLLVLSISASWRFIFMVLKPVSVKSFPYSQKGIDYFDSVKLSTFYYSMSIEYVNLIDSYKGAIEKKTEFLKRAFSEIKCSGLLLLIFLSSFFIGNVLFSTVKF